MPAGREGSRREGERAGGERAGGPPLAGDGLLVPSLEQHGGGPLAREWCAGGLIPTGPPWSGIPAVQAGAIQSCNVPCRVVWLAEASLSNASTGPFFDGGALTDQVSDIELGRAMTLGIEPHRMQMEIRIRT